MTNAGVALSPRDEPTRKASFMRSVVLAPACSHDAMRNSGSEGGVHTGEFVDRGEPRKQP